MVHSFGKTQISIKSISPIAGNEPQANKPLDFVSFKTCEETYTYSSGELSENIGLSQVIRTELKETMLMQIERGD